MPRQVVYTTSLVLFLIGTALTLAAIASPTWLTYTSSPSTFPSESEHISLGLHARCSSLTSPSCAPYPDARVHCSGPGGASFCAAWRSVAFVLNLAVVLELAALVGYVVVLVGDRERRGYGWKMVAGLVGTVAGVVLVGWAVVLGLWLGDGVRFGEGWEMGMGMGLCVGAWVVMGLTAGGIGLVGAKGWWVEREEGYETIE